MLFTCIDYYVIARSRHKGGDVAIPRLEGKCIENCPKIYGIATPVCALVRNDVLLFSALNNNLHYLFCSSQISSTAISAGETPEILLACPMDMGRMACNFSLASSRRPVMAS